MNTSKEAIKHIQDTAHYNQKIEETNFDCIALSENVKLHDLEEFQECRNNFRGTLYTSSVIDFANYIDDHDGKNCFIDVDDMSAKSIFDLGDKEKPGHAKHNAVLKLKRTAPYTELLHHDNRESGQRALGDWLEDWKDFIQVIDEDGKDMETHKAVSAIRSITIEAIKKKGSEIKNFGESKSSIESIDAQTADGPMPAWIIFDCKPYEDLPERKFHSRININTGGDTPRFTTKIVQLEAIQEEIANDFKNLLIKKLNDESDIYLGTFTA